MFSRRMGKRKDLAADGSDVFRPCSLHDVALLSSRYVDVLTPFATVAQMGSPTPPVGAARSTIEELDAWK